MTSNKTYKFWALMLAATGCYFRVYEVSGLPDNGRQEEFVYTSMGTLLCLCLMFRSLGHKKESCS